MPVGESVRLLRRIPRRFESLVQNVHRLSASRASGPLAGVPDVWIAHSPLSRHFRTFGVKSPSRAVRRSSHGSRPFSCRFVASNTIGRQVSGPNGRTVDSVTVPEGGWRPNEGPGGAIYTVRDKK